MATAVQEVIEHRRTRRLPGGDWEEEEATRPLFPTGFFAALVMGDVDQINGFVGEEGVAQLEEMKRVGPSPPTPPSAPTSTGGAAVTCPGCKGPLPGLDAGPGAGEPRAGGAGCGSGP